MIDKKWREKGQAALPVDDRSFPMSPREGWGFGLKQNVSRKSSGISPLPRERTQWDE